jgi:hypothetical protein
MKRGTVARTIAGIFFVAVGPGQALAASCTTGTNYTLVTSSGGTTETGSVAFGNLSGSTKTVTVGGLTLTCTGTFVASTSVAAFFASLPNGSAGGTLPVGEGCSASGNLTGWASGTRTSSTVVFTSTTPDQDVTNLAVLGQATDTETNGSAGTGSLVTLLSGHIACRGSGPNWTEQEVQNSNQTLYDAGDPSHRITGDWGIGTNQVTYTYAGGASYTFSVYQDGASGGLYDFCNGTTLIHHDVKMENASSCS